MTQPVPDTKEFRVKGERELLIVSNPFFGLYKLIKSTHAV